MTRGPASPTTTRGRTGDGPLVTAASDLDHLSARGSSRPGERSQSDRSPGGRLRLIRHGGFGMNRAYLTIVARRLADPAPECVIERADFGVAQRKGDLRQRQSLILQEVQRQRLAHVVLE